MQAPGWRPPLSHPRAAAGLRDARLRRLRLLRCGPGGDADRPGRGVPRGRAGPRDRVVPHRGSRPRRRRRGLLAETESLAAARHPTAAEVDELRSRVEPVLRAVAHDARAPYDGPRAAAGADLAGADLRGDDLRGADLRGALLIGADLRAADLTDADLLGADLRGADLGGADLSRALFVTRRQLGSATEFPEPGGNSRHGCGHNRSWDERWRRWRPPKGARRTASIRQRQASEDMRHCPQIGLARCWLSRSSPRRTGLRIRPRRFARVTSLPVGVMERPDRPMSDPAGRSAPRPGHGQPPCRFSPSSQRTRRCRRFPRCRPGRRSR